MGGNQIVAPTMGQQRARTGGFFTAATDEFPDATVRVRTRG